MHPSTPAPSPPSLLCNGHRVSFPGVQLPGRGVDHPISSKTEVKERVKLYLYSRLDLNGLFWGEVISLYLGSIWNLNFPNTIDGLIKEYDQAPLFSGYLMQLIRRIRCNRDVSSRHAEC